MASAAGQLARRDAPIDRDAFGRTMAMLAGGGVLALAALWAAAQVLPSGDVGVATALNETAAIVDQHADAMVGHGERLLAAARSGAGADRDHWLSDAQHMIADGQGLHAIAADLRADARALGDQPGQVTGASPSLLSAKSARLSGQAGAMIAHGQAMIEHAAVMAELAREPGSAVTMADAQLMAEDAPRITDAGERVLRVADVLYATAAQLRGALRR